MSLMPRTLRSSLSRSPYVDVLRHEVALRRRGSRAELPEASSVPPVHETVRVDAAGNRAFCDAVGGPTTPRAHWGYLHALTFAPSMRTMSSPEFPLPLLGLVHLRNETRCLVPVDLGQDVEVTSAVAEFGSHRRGTTVTLRAEIRDAAGQLLFTDESLYLHKSSAAQAGSGSPGPGSSSTGSTSGERASRRGRENAAGRTLIGSWRLAADTGRIYAAASGDRNPIHLSSLSARAFGMPGAIAHGMYTASRALGQALGSPDGVGWWRVEFGAPVRIPGRVNLWRESADRGMRIVGTTPKPRTAFVVECGVGEDVGEQVSASV